uniref:NADH-ubiquinone oxidoreductase chain 1 n=1 Tax=Baltalimania ylvae TaxID=3341436 RepID=A0A1X9WD96_9BILA|nr:NADH dehydrogenase subunit 1 [Archaphanostoma ylvae]ARS00899.1 NADH dehydrogenase subunit 1 [Archaphanostoma ylvae]
MIKHLVMVIGILLSVAFLTLVERKVLGYIHLRKGPNLVGILGLTQPFSDGLKLVSKQIILTSFSKMMISSAPVIFFFISILVWMPLINGALSISQNFLLLLFLSSLGALLIFIAGWGGGSTFSFMGGIRASAQMISYEVILSFLLMLPLLFFFQLCFQNLNLMMFLSSWTSFIIIFPMIVLVMLAETNRAPFDLTEGESELVSGFNTEFSSTLFVLLFLGEYSFLILFSFISSLLCFNTSWYWIGFITMFLWLRACFPRKRYDLLMSLMWIYLFPLACLFLMFQYTMVMM